MKTEIRFNRTFRKQYDKVDNKIRATFDKKFLLFQKEPFHPQLNNHSLSGKYKGFRSINITGDWRALYTEVVGKDGQPVILFVLLGTHSQLYK